MNIAFFVTFHGFGHAARAGAVMEFLHTLRPDINFELYTTVPDWFFKDIPSINYNSVAVDVGLVQQNSLDVDLEATLRQLDQFYPFQNALLDSLAKQISQKNCKLVLCDISPLGIEVAKTAGIPSILIENFTWDWIYKGYLSRKPELEKTITYLREIFDSATWHIQTEPLCEPRKVSLVVAPISRKVRTPLHVIRNQLNVGPDEKLVLITMGGTPEEYPFLLELKKNWNQLRFLVLCPVANPKKDGNLLLYPRNSPFFHPDLVNACDLVIGKVGYSTIAEIFHIGVPFGYFTRPNFPEMPPLVKYIENHIQGIELDSSEFASGKWTKHLPALLDFSGVDRHAINGGTQVAQFIKELI